MASPETFASGAITHAGLSQYHPAVLSKTTLKASCQQYLEIRSELEAVDHENDRLTKQLGTITARVAELLGPMDGPLVMEVDGVLVVIHVAEGLLMPGQLTASLSVAARAEDLMGEEVVL